MRPFRCRRPSRASASGPRPGRSSPCRARRTGRGRRPGRERHSTSTGAVRMPHQPGVGRARFSLVAAQNASRSAGARRTRKSQPWLNPALGAADCLGQAGERRLIRDRPVRVVLAHHATAVNRISQQHRRHARSKAAMPRLALWHRCATLPPGYPVAWEADVVLRDGTVAHVRPITPDDADGLREFHAGQSEESIYMRFFAPLRELSNRDVDRFTVVDYDGGSPSSRPCGVTSSGSGATTRSTAPPPRWPSTSPTTTRARGSARSCSSTCPRSGTRPGSPGSSPRCSRATARCSTSSRRPATRSSTASRTASWSSRSTSPRPLSQRRSASPASTGPRRSVSVASSPRPRSPSSARAAAPTRSARPCCATCSPASSPARCMP